MGDSLGTCRGTWCVRGPTDGIGDEASLILNPAPMLGFTPCFTHFYLFAHSHHIYSFSGLIAPHHGNPVVAPHRPLLIPQTLTHSPEVETVKGQQKTSGGLRWTALRCILLMQIEEMDCEYQTDYEAIVEEEQALLKEEDEDNFPVMRCGCGCGPVPATTAECNTHVPAHAHAHAHARARVRAHTHIHTYISTKARMSHSLRQSTTKHMKHLLPVYSVGGPNCPLNFCEMRRCNAYFAISRNGA